MKLYVLYVYYELAKSPYDAPISFTPTAPLLNSFSQPIS